MGIDINNLAPGFTSMDGERFVVIRDKNPPPGGQTGFCVVDLKTRSPPQKKPTQAQLVLCHPTRNVLAFSAKSHIEAFDIDKKEQLLGIDVNGAVVFWRWLNEKTVAIVTELSVYHWNLLDKQQPEKMFDRINELGDGNQIVGYRTDKELKWGALMGLSVSNGRPVGNIQLFSKAKKSSQYIPGYGATFCNIKVDGASKESVIFLFVQKGASSKLIVGEVERGQQDKAFNKCDIDIPMGPEQEQDFPVGTINSDRYDMAFLLTKFGFFYMFHLSGRLILHTRISNEIVFHVNQRDSTGGLICINKRGQVLSLSVDDKNIVSYISNVLRDSQLALKLAGKANLPGADSTFQQQFEQLISSQQYREAAHLATSSPGSLIRNKNTIQRLQSLPVMPGQQPPLFQYLGGIIEKGKLNKEESIELGKMIVGQGKAPLLEKWLQEDKLECSVELGNMIKNIEPRLALNIYNGCQAYEEVVQCLAELGQYDKIVSFCEKVNYQPNIVPIVDKLLTSNPEAASKFVISLSKTSLGKGLNLKGIVEQFISRNYIKEATALLLDTISDEPQYGELQTKLLEMNLKTAPQVADAIISQKLFTHYDRKVIGKMCEHSRLFLRALEHYTDPVDIRRVISNAIGQAQAQALSSGTNAGEELITEVFGQLDPNDAIDILNELLRVNIRMNLKIVVSICSKYSDVLTSEAIIAMFDKFKSYEGMFYYLNAIIKESTDPEVHFKYIEAAARIGQTQELERMCKESDIFDPKKVKNLLEQLKLPDQLPLIIVCDRFGFVEDLTKYLYTNNFSKYIEAYVFKINPTSTPAVAGALLDCGCSEDYIRSLIMNVRGQCPIEPLVEVVESRNRLRLLLPWLEQRLGEGNPDPVLHNALAKIYIDIGKEPEDFLINDQFYDSLVVGKYCEERDPYLAFVAYKRGNLDDNVIEVTTQHALWKYQAEYLVERREEELYKVVLDIENENRQLVIDQIIQTILPNCKDENEVTAAVKAFIVADMPEELISLLDKLIFENEDFKDNPTLQTLLIHTAVKAKSNKVMDYINKLKHYQANEVAKVCIENELFEEAFTIYNREKNYLQAIDVILENLQDVTRAQEFANKINEKEVYSRLGTVELNQGLVKEAISNFLLAGDHEMFHDVIISAETLELYEELIPYLEMARKEVKDQRIETSLLFCFAKTNKLKEIEEFLSTPNCAQIQNVGDRCYECELYEAARLFYANINNYVKLASTLIHLKRYSEAVESAKKANSTKAFKAVCIACIEAKEFKYAQMCGLQLLIHGDELADLLMHYENRGYFEQVMEMFEKAITMEKMHPSIHTELAILYAKYNNDKLLDFLKQHINKITIHRVVNVANKYQLWKELTFLYMQEQPENAIETMIKHSPICWNHKTFCDAFERTKRNDIIHKSVEFYIAEHPILLEELAAHLSQNADPTVLIDKVDRMQHLPLIKPYLKSIQDINNKVVNETLNKLLIEEFDYEGLKKSVSTYTNFDAITLAKELEQHDLLELRRVAILVYSQGKNYSKAIELCKGDGLYKDAIEAATISKDRELSETLVKYFAENKMEPELVALLFSCYSTIRPDIVLEIGWKYKLSEYCFPFMIQKIRETDDKLNKIIAKMDAEEERKKKKKERKERGESGFDEPIAMPAFGGANLLMAPGAQYYPPPMQQMPFQPPMQSQFPQQNMPF